MYYRNVSARTGAGQVARGGCCRRAHARPAACPVQGAVGDSPADQGRLHEIQRGRSESHQQDPQRDVAQPAVAEHRADADDGQSDSRRRHRSRQQRHRRLSVSGPAPARTLSAMCAGRPMVRPAKAPDGRRRYFDLIFRAGCPVPKAGCAPSPTLQKSAPAGRRLTS